MPSLLLFQWNDPWVSAMTQELLTPASLSLSNHNNLQVRKFKPEMVAIRDASKIGELKELLKGLPGKMPDILAGDEGAVEVARHASAEVRGAGQGTTYAYG